MDETVRRSISGLARLPAGTVERGTGRLASDLADGTWHRRHGELADLDELDAGYRLVVAGRGTRSGSSYRRDRAAGRGPGKSLTG